MWKLVLASLLTLVVTVPVSPSAAQAVSPRISSSDWLRNCTDTGNQGCQQAGTWSAGTDVTMHCWIDDSWYTGEYASNRWFFVSAGNTKGFIHSSRVTNQVSTPHCGGNPGVSAARWAAMHIGETRPSAAEASGLNINDNMWSGWCAAFTTGAYRWGYGTDPAFAGDAKDRYNKYLNAAAIQPWDTTDPEIGSIVFWPNASAWGHTAIYVGNGQVVSTQGLGNPSLPVARLSATTTWGTPTGWVKPADVYQASHTGLLRSYGSGGSQCLDLTSYATHTPITLFPCYSGASNQWNRPGNGTIRSAGSGNNQCLDLSSYATHTPVILYPCHGGASQQWVFRPDGTISNAGSGNAQCIDLTSYATGTGVKLFPCYGGTSQRWHR